jgi:thiol-disulfide isomerase/thioredoxin
MKSRFATPTLMTLVLSLAAVAGYVTYRFVMPADIGSPQETATARAPGLADTLPDFTLMNLDGQMQSMHDWHGEPLIINFWATWCAPCLREIPLLKSVQEENPWLRVVGIALDRRPDVLEFAEDMQFNYPVLQGEADAFEAASSFGAEFIAMPFTIFADDHGHLLGVYTGELHAEELQNVVAVLADRASGRIGVEQARQRIAALM